MAHSIALVQRNAWARAHAVVREASQAGSPVDFKSLPVVELVVGLVLAILSIKISAGNEFSLGRTALLLCLCGLITAYGIIRNPYAPFYVFAFVMPLFAALGTSVALVLGGTLAIFYHRERLRWMWQFSWAGAAFCLWATASVAWAERPYFEQDSFAVQAFPAMILAFVISGIKDRQFLRNMLLMVVGACVIGSMSSLRNWLRGGGDFRGGMSVYSLIRPDVFSAWEILGLLGALAWLLAGRPVHWLRGILFLSLPLILMGIGLCGYRAAILAAIVGVMVTCFCQKRLLQGILFIGVVSATAGLLYLVQPEMFSPVVSRFQTIHEDRGSERLDIWEGGIRVFSEHPLLGVGCDNFQFAVSRLIARQILPHSIYVGTLVELGTIGFVLLVVWICVLLRKTWRAQERLWVFPVLVAFLIQAAFLHEFYFSCFWLVLGLAEGAGSGKSDCQNIPQHADRAFRPRLGACNQPKRASRVMLAGRRRLRVN